MAEALIFHYRHQMRFLNRANPLIKLLAIISLCIALFALPLAGALTISLAFVAVAAFHRLPIIRYRRELRYFAALTLLIIATDFFVTRSTAVAVLSALRFITVILAGLLLTDCTATDDLARSLGSALHRLPWIDGWAIASTIELTLSLLPILFDAAKEVSDARKARLAPRKWPLKELTSLGSQIFSLTLDKVEDLSLALQGRQFSPSQARRSPPYRAGDLWLGVTTIALVALATVVSR
ncbi:MAG TPA: energy-coupling factor transporter transmembrane component T [Sphaerochaeta sp.]|nr:energy-coupling factor transporter transmembrane component T [Sphaerochaeta sp.]